MRETQNCNKIATRRSIRNLPAQEKGTDRSQLKPYYLSSPNSVEYHPKISEDLSRDSMSSRLDKHCLSPSIDLTTVANGNCL